MFEFCENGAKAVAWETDPRQCGPEFFAQHSVVELSNRDEYWLGQQGRLTHPMVLKEGATHYEPIAWDAAYQMIADELNALESPDEAIFYTSGRASNESAFLYAVFARHFGTNNMPDCSNMCHESSGSALTESIGIGKGTVKIEDFTKAQVIFLIGHNPATNHPRMMTTLAEAKQAGATIIAVNPLVEAGLLRFKDPQEPKGVIGHGQKMADIYLHVRINGDIALFKGIMKEMLALEDANPGHAFDWDFIRAKTAGIDDFLAQLRREDIDELVLESGVARDKMQEVAALLVKSERIITAWCLGLTQQRTGVQSIQELVNLNLLRGALGKPGAGVCPVRGHSNVQGDRTMGVWERPREPYLNKLQSVFGFDPPRQHGHDVVESIKAMHAGDRPIFSWGWAAISSVRHVGYRTTRRPRRCKQHAASRHTFQHQTQPLATSSPARRRSSCRRSVAPKSTSRRPVRSSSRPRIRWAWSRCRAAGSSRRRSSSGPSRP